MPESARSEEFVCWKLAPVSLAYRLGEITLFRRAFRGLVLDRHFFQLSSDPDEPTPPIDELGARVDVIATRSHPVASPLPAVSMWHGALRYVSAHYHRCHADLAGDFEAYLGKFSAKTRSTLKRKVRKVLEMGEESGMRVYKAPEEMAEFHRLARAVSALTYQEKLFDAGIPDDQGFLEELTELARANALRCYALFNHGRAVAYLCCPVVDGVLLYRYLGYDPSQAHLSPGTVLQYLALESLFEERAFRALDFTEGQGEHKRFFGTHETLCADIFYFRPTLSARAWVEMHRGVDRLSSLCGRVLERAKLKARIKRILRRH